MPKKKKTDVLVLKVDSDNVLKLSGGELNSVSF